MGRKAAARADCERSCARLVWGAGRHRRRRRRWSGHSWPLAGRPLRMRIWATLRPTWQTPATPAATRIASAALPCTESQLRCALRSICVSVDVLAAGASTVSRPGHGHTARLCASLLAAPAFVAAVVPLRRCAVHASMCPVWCNCRWLWHACA